MTRMGEKGKQKKKKKKPKRLKMLGWTFVNAHGENVARQDAIAKKGMLSCSILSTLDF